MFQCLTCGLKFAEEQRLDIHNKTHEKSKAKNKTKRRADMPDFEKPDFSQVMWQESNQHHVIDASTNH
jgi:hypothetical protein